MLSVVYFRCGEELGDTRFDLLRVWTPLFFGDVFPVLDDNFCPIDIFGRSDDVLIRIKSFVYFGSGAWFY